MDSCECGNEPPTSIKTGNVASFLPGRAKDLSAPPYAHSLVGKAAVTKPLGGPVCRWEGNSKTNIKEKGYGSCISVIYLRKGPVVDSSHQHNELPAMGGSTL